MKKLLAGIALLCLMPATASAQKSAMRMTPGAQTKTGEGVGVVQALDLKGSKVTIKHGAISSIGWPAMTMTFRASPAAILKPVHVGQRVSFTATVRGMDAQITGIRSR